MMTRRSWLFHIFALALLAFLTASGCGGSRGGSGSSSGVGRAVANISIEWPKEGRYIPFAAGAILLEANNVDNTPLGLGFKLFRSDDSEITPPGVGANFVIIPSPGAGGSVRVQINNLPVGKQVRFNARAFPTPAAAAAPTNPLNVAQAIVSPPLVITIQDNSENPRQGNEINLTMSTTVRSVGFLVDGQATAVTSQVPDDEFTVTPIAKDDQNRTIMMDYTDFDIQSADGTVNVSTNTTTKTTTARLRAGVQVGKIQLVEKESRLPAELTVNKIDPTPSGGVGQTVGNPANPVGTSANNRPGNYIEPEVAFANNFVYLLAYDPMQPSTTQATVFRANAPAAGTLSLTFTGTPIHPPTTTPPQRIRMTHNTSSVVLTPFLNTTTMKPQVQFYLADSGTPTSFDLEFTSILDLDSRVVVEPDPLDLIYVLGKTGTSFQIGVLRQSGSQSTVAVNAPGDLQFIAVDNVGNVYLYLADGRIVRQDPRGAISEPFGTSNQRVRPGAKDMCSDGTYLYLLYNDGVDVYSTTAAVTPSERLFQFIPANSNPVTADDFGNARSIAAQVVTASTNTRRVYMVSRNLFANDPGGNPSSTAAVNVRVHVLQFTGQ